MTTQDGYDWPTPRLQAPEVRECEPTPQQVLDEWAAQADKYQPATRYWREQLAVLDLRERAELRAELTAASLRRLAERTVPHHPV